MYMFHCFVLILQNIARHPHFSFMKPGFMVGGTYNPLSETWEGSYRKHKNDAVVQRFVQMLSVLHVRILI